MGMGIEQRLIRFRIHGLDGAAAHAGARNDHGLKLAIGNVLWRDHIV
jgi:hypothetical protein